MTQYRMGVRWICAALVAGGLALGGATAAEA